MYGNAYNVIVHGVAPSHHDASGCGEAGSAVQVADAQHVVGEQAVHALAVPCKGLLLGWGAHVLQVLQAYAAALCISSLTLANIVQLRDEHGACNMCRLHTPYAPCV